MWSWVAWLCLVCVASWPCPQEVHVLCLGNCDLVLMEPVEAMYVLFMLFF